MKRIIKWEDDFEEEVELEEEESSTNGDPINFWEKKQREVLLSVVDYNLQTLADLVSTKAIDVSPEYQRRERWDQKRQSKLIESLLMQVPVPPVYLNEDEYGKYSVIDGKQRILAITAFMKNRLVLAGLKVFSDINGKTFDDLPPVFQTIIKTRPTIRAVFILRQSDKDVKFEVFKRLNTGGVRLNAQEIRNSTFPGKLNDLVLRLSQDGEFHSLLGIKNKAKSRMYKEMKDAELVVRFFTFRKTWKTFPGAIMRCMDTFMHDHQHASDKVIREFEKDFNETIACVAAAFGEHAFKRWVPEKKAWRQQAVASLYDAQMFACRGRSVDSLKKASKRIIVEYKKLFEDDTFRKHIDAATNAPTSFKERIRKIEGVLDSA